MLPVRPRRSLVRNVAMDDRATFLVSQVVLVVVVWCSPSVHCQTSCECSGSSQIHGLSDKNVSWIRGDNGNLFVGLGDGFSNLSFTWRRQQTGSSHIEDIVDDDAHFLLSGDYRLNLTVVDVVKNDSGNYFLSVTGNGINTSLCFEVKVLASPRLLAISESPLVFRTGSNVTLEVAILDAIPMVVSSNITWNPDGDVKTFDENNASATFKNISALDTSEVTVTISHPAGNQSHTFHLTILDPAIAPAVFNITAAENKVCMVVFTWQTVILVNSTTSALTDKVGLERSVNGVSQWQEFGDEQCYAPNGSAMFVLPPEAVYYFRAYSWNNTMGRGEETEVVTFSTIGVSSYIPRVQSLSVTGVNSSSISISWDNLPVDCYNFTGYQLTCQYLENGNVNHTSIQIKTSSHGNSVTLTNLPSDTLFNCSVQVIGETSTGQPFFFDPSSSDIGRTLPEAPPQPPAPLVANEQGAPGTIVLDLSILGDSFSPDDASHLWIVIIRLVSPTLPPRSANELYPDTSLFVDSPLSGSPKGGNGFYQPYLAAELMVGSLPSTFIIGNGTNTTSSSRSSTTETHLPATYNGLLNTSDYYTCFFRVFSYSSLLEKQYDVFNSSAYLIPRQPTASSTPNTESAEANTLRIVIGVTSALLVLALVITSALTFVCICNRHKTMPTDNDDPQFKIAFGTPRRKPSHSTAANNLAHDEGQDHSLPMATFPPLQQESSNTMYKNN